MTQTSRGQSHRRASATFAMPVLTSLAIATALVASLAACEHGTGGGVGTVGGAALGAGVGRAAFGNNTGAMLIGGAVGGLAGNQMVDRPNQDRQQQRVESSRDAQMQRQLDFERQRALQQHDVQRQIEEERLFDEWRRQQG